MNQISLEQVGVAEKVGDWIARSGMFGVATPDQGKIIAFSALANGLDPFQYMRPYHVVEGKLTMRADAMLAELEKAGGKVQWKKTTPEVCEALFFAPGATKGEAVIVSMEELVKSGIAISKDGKVKTNYKRSPQQMLRARAVSQGVRMVCSAAIAGYYTPEETADFEDAPKAEKSSWTKGIPAPEPAPALPQAKPPEVPPPSMPAPSPASPAADDTVPPVEATRPPAAEAGKAQKDIFKEVSDALAAWMRRTGENDVLKVRSKFLNGRKMKEIPTGELPAILAAVIAE